MTDALALFGQSIQDSDLPLLLAVSGGRDSMVLLHLASLADIPFAVAHCNFHLRPGDCDRDEQFVRRQAQHYGAECFVAQFNTTDYANAHHLSIEEAARQLRYQFFDDLCRQHGFGAVATAHHQGDAVETFFLNLLRGTGITGLHGIRQRNGRVVRPLLSLSRDDINALVADYNLPFVEDQTNADTRFRRNWIRHQLLPLIKSEAPAFESTMQENLRNLGEAEQLYHQAIEHYRNELLAPGDAPHAYTLNREALAKVSPLRTILFELLRPFGFNAANVDTLLTLPPEASGRRLLSPTHLLIVDRKTILIQPLDAPVQATPRICTRLRTLQECGAIIEGHRVRVACPKDKALFDADRLVPPLTLRHWETGDRFQPLGVNGTQLVSDYFSDHKYSLLQKQQQWLLTDAAGTILWLVGARTAQQASLTPATQRVLEVWIEE